MYTGVTSTPFNATLYINGSIWGYYGDWEETMSDMMSGTFSLMWDRNKSIGNTYNTNYSILVQRWGQYYDDYYDIETGESWTFWYNTTMWLNGTYQSVRIDGVIDDDLIILGSPSLNPEMQLFAEPPVEMEVYQQENITQALIDEDVLKELDTVVEEVYVEEYKEPLFIDILKVDPCGFTVLNIGLICVFKKRVI
jgi:hypothetical protein